MVRRHGAGKAAGQLWNRLTAVDFFGHSFQLAALAMLCFFPFLIVVTAAVGRDAATSLADWLGLDQKAAQSVASLFSPRQDTGALTVTSAFLLVLGAGATAGVLQNWYQTVFDVPTRGWRDNVPRLYWLVSLLAYGVAQAALAGALGAAPGGLVFQTLTGLVVATLFWWWSMHVLLAGAVGWRALRPAAVATGVCWTGLGVFSSRYFSSAIVANEQEYGSIGVVMIILSWLVAVGVVIHLGAVVGRFSLERRARPSPTNDHPDPSPDRPQD
ncbi:YhjD/YihY/BrkB family envelope integrity protein [Streptomyces sp. NPDC048219]|uniref:YhjD/YihY/BrkB family envelope integrity protein n=1 Tax=unclassified Streptomyces TaxID=2593676 RepID=UPI003445664E